MKDQDYHAKDLTTLIDLIDQAYYHAMSAGLDTTAFILGMASLEALEKRDEVNQAEARLNDIVSN